jgi:hypothetical protein
MPLLRQAAAPARRLPALADACIFLLTMIRRLLAAFGLLSFAAAPALADGVTATGTYAISLGGTNIATAVVTLNDDGNRYAMGLDARVIGFAQFVAGGIAKVESAGLSTGSGLVSEKFDLLTRSQGEQFTVDVAFAQQDVAAFVVDPPVPELGRVAIERRHLHDVNDMMAALVIKARSFSGELCNRDMQIFTGTERFNLSMRFAREDEATSLRTGYQGPLILCTIRYTPISGHYTTSELTTHLAHSDRILVWYAPLATSGTFIPYRALLATGTGDLSVVLTRLEQ